MTCTCSYEFRVSAGNMNMEAYGPPAVIYQVLAGLAPPTT